MRLRRDRGSERLGLPPAVARYVRRNPVLRSGVVMLRHAGLSPQDAFLTSYPKSGNTWVKFMLSYLLAGHEADFDTDAEVVPMVGSHAGAPRVLPGGGRLIKSHEPWRRSYADKYARVVYIARDGRDVAVSYYYDMLRTGSFEGPFSRFLDLFLEARVDGYGAWHEHVLSWLVGSGAARDRLLVLRYEDLLEDPAAGLERMADFLGTAQARAAIEAAVERNSAERMRERERASRFHARQANPGILAVRSASAGGWRELFTPDDLERFVAVAGGALAELGYASHPSASGSRPG